MDGSFFNFISRFEASSKSYQNGHVKNILKPSPTSNIP